MADTDALSIYDEIEIEDMTYDPTLQIYHYPCPCGDRFEIGIADLRDGEEIAVCPSCSLMVKVIFDLVSVLFSFCAFFFSCGVMVVDTRAGGGGGVERGLDRRREIRNRAFFILFYFANEVYK